MRSRCASSETPSVACPVVETLMYAKHFIGIYSSASAGALTAPTPAGLI